MPTLKVFSGGMTRLNKEIVDSGFPPGTRAEIIKNAFSFTVVKPGATLEQLEHSLEIQLDDIRLRLGKSKLREVLREK
ncbi:hypothetical protein ES708_04156 [subsurface metagenome]